MLLCFISSTIRQLFKKFQGVFQSSLSGLSHESIQTETWHWGKVINLHL